MNETLRSMSAVGVVLILLAGAGCVTESSNTTANRPTNSAANTTANRSTNPVANTNATSATPTTPEPTPAKTGNAAPNTQPVTLPVLDAFFAQENFAAELKSKLQLT